MKEVVIVGAGPGGLASAMLLAKAGVKTRVFEQSGRVGGRTSTIDADGFRFDMGPTFFLYPRPLKEVFALVGRDLEEEINLVRLDPQYRLVFGEGGELLATPQPDEMDRRIRHLAPSDRGGFQKFMTSNRHKLRRIAPILQRPFLSWWDLIRSDNLKVLKVLHPTWSLNRELQQFFADPRILLGMSFQSKYLGMSPFTCPSLFSILPFLEYEYGVFHPMGGCGALSRTMAKIAEDSGAEIALNEPVSRILFEGRRAVGVVTPSGEHRADLVVINADFARAMMNLVPNKVRRRWTNERIARKRYSCSCFMIYLGIEGRYEDQHHHTIYFSRDYRRNLEEIEEKHVLSEDPSFYVQNVAVTDPSMAPKGMSTLYILVPVTHLHPNVDWNRDTGPFRDLVIRQLPKIGLRGVESRIRLERVFTPRDWEQEQQIHLGATFNLAHNLGQMLHLRPRNRFEDLEGIYLVGGGTHPGSGLPVIYESARITTRLVLEDFSMDVNWLEYPSLEGD